MDRPHSEWTTEEWQASAAALRRRRRLQAARKRVAAIRDGDPALLDEEFAELRSMLYPPGELIGD